MTVGANVREAACHAFFLEDAAKVEIAILAAPDSARAYTPEQAQKRASADKSLYARMWEFLLDFDASASEVHS